ncbi:MAG: arylsulfatase A-like enzyme [Planctomycetota bacterium]|jgi:arylsulfatase A-like enzyme
MHLQRQACSTGHTHLGSAGVGAYTPVISCLCAVLLAVLGTACDAQKEAPRPNIVFYLCDTLRADHLGTYGYERNTTPNIDLMAKDAIVFENAFAPSSWTKASTASLLTGLGPRQHNANGRDTRLSDRVQLISETLKELGYYNTGIITNPFVSETFGFDQGYDEFQFLGRALAEKLIDKVVEALDKRPIEKPFFLYVHSIDPHAPYHAPKPYQQAFTDKEWIGNPDMLHSESTPTDIRAEIDSYDGELLYHDAQFKRLITKLKSEGLYENSMIWFVSDHGDEFLEHGRGGHGRSLFKESIHIPMILKLPGNQRSGTRVKVPASSIDVVPTMLSYLNVLPPKESEGIDLLTNLTERSSRPTLFLDLDLMVEKLYVATGVIQGQYKYVEETLPEPRSFLFDLEADPEEKVNLIESHPETVAELAMMLKIHNQGQQAGITVRIVGKGSNSLVATLRTDGKFIDVVPMEMEPGDILEIDESGQLLTLQLELKDFRSNIGNLRTSDIDSFTVKLDPPNANLMVESMELLDSAQEIPLFLGNDRVKTSLPHSVSINDPAIITEDLGLLFRKERMAASMHVRGDVDRVLQPPPGMYVVALKEVAREEIDSMSDEIRKQLEDLGYLGHDTPKDE